MAQWKYLKNIVKYTLYYDKLRKNNLVEFDRNDIQRKLKLTEGVSPILLKENPWFISLKISKLFPCSFPDNEKLWNLLYSLAL